MDQVDTQPIKSFFDNRTTYDKIIYYNYMVHKEIHVEIRNFLEKNIKDEYDILDLGCGDCSHLSETISGTGVRKYVGVDISPAALEQATMHLEDSTNDTELIEDDFINYVENCDNNKYDIVLTGYSIHHLFYHHKQQFFDTCSRILKDGGCLVHYDVVRLHDETREQYIERYFKIIDSWVNLDSEDKQSVKFHIKECDFPSSYEEIVFMAVNSGFTSKPGRIYADKHRIHTLSCFIK